MTDQPCKLSFNEIDDFDEISGDEQFVLIWCDTHDKWEWKWVDRQTLRSYGH